LRSIGSPKRLFIGIDADLNLLVDFVKRVDVVFNPRPDQFCEAYATCCFVTKLPPFLFRAQL
jgi:hypothetical protein